MKLIVTIEPGDPDALIDPGVLVAALDALAPAPLALNIARATDDIQPRDDLPRSLFLPHEMGEIAAAVEYWPPEGVDSATAFDIVAGVAAGAGFGPASGYVTTETIVLDYEQTWPDGQPTPGFKMVSVGRRREDLTVEQFEHHWRTVHGPLALRHHVGMFRYVQDLVIDRLGNARAIVDSMAELYFPTTKDFVERLYDSKEGRKIIAADSRNFGGGGDTHFFEETILHPRTDQPD